MSTGVEVIVLSVNHDGIWEDNATIRFAADGSFTLTLPGGRTITVTDADERSTVPNSILGTTRKQYQIGSLRGTSVTVDLGEDAVGRDLFQVVRVDDGLISPDRDSYLIFGAGTETLPDGTANFAGGFEAQAFDAAGKFISAYSGSSAIGVDFATGSVTVTLDDISDPDQFTGTGTIVPDTSLYSGSIGTTAGPTSFSGDLAGGFFGAGAEGTAGTFHATDTSDPAATKTLLGAFTGFRSSP